MNILQINTADTKGGAGQVAYRLKHELKKRGHQTSYLVSKKYSRDNDDVDVKLIRPYSNLRQRIYKKLSYWLANDLDIFQSNHILNMPEFKSADIIHCHNLHSNYFNLTSLQKISRLKPVIWTFHDMWPITAHCAHSFDGVLKENGFFTCPSLDIYPPIAWHNEKYLEKRKKEIYEKSNFHIVTPSKWLSDKVSRSMLKHKPISVIYNGVDTNIFRPLSQEQCRQELDLPQDKKIVLFLAKRGRSNPWKGGSYAEDVVSAFQGKNDIFFIDLGGDKSEIIGNRKFVGFVTNENILIKYYSAADTLLYPSIADNCPLVVLEAQACGLPVVAFKTGGIPELIEHQKTGFVADYKNLNDLKAGLDFILNLNNIQVKNFRENSVKNIADNFSKEIMVNNYIQLYEKEISAFNSSNAL